MRRDAAPNTRQPFMRTSPGWGFAGRSRCCDSPPVCTPMGRRSGSSTPWGSSIQASRAAPRLRVSWQSAIVPDRGHAIPMASRSIRAAPRTYLRPSAGKPAIHSRCASTWPPRLRLPANAAAARLCAGPKSAPVRAATPKPLSPIRAHGAMSSWRGVMCRAAIICRWRSTMPIRASPMWCAGMTCSTPPACTVCCRSCFGCRSRSITTIASSATPRGASCPNRPVPQACASCGRPAPRQPTSVGQWHSRTPALAPTRPSWTPKPSCVDVSGLRAPLPSLPRMRGREGRGAERGNWSELTKNPMLQGWFVIAVALVYIGLLFVIASYGDRLSRRGGTDRPRPLIYPLSLAIYCTSWTFFGSVGLATRSGFDFLAIYIGPIAMIGLASPPIAHITRLSKTQNIVSIADFIGARYGKHQGVAATVALIAIVGTIPYIALQLKAVSSSLDTIVAPLATWAGPVQPMLGDPPLLVAVSLAAFAVLFGTRHIDATEHQHGLMLAIAVESIVKLVAFLAVGIFVTFVMFEGPVALFAKALQRPDTTAVLTTGTSLGTMGAITLLSLSAIILLPRQFHVTVVENKNESEIRGAAWLFPAYLVLINLFVVPVAIAGMLTFSPGAVDSDMYVLALPISAGSEFLALVAFIGGLSAAAAMVIVETIALAIMVSNDIVVPLALLGRHGANVGTHLLTVRRIAIFVVLLFAYLYYRSAGEAQLAAIGLMAFAAIAQLAA